MHLALARQRPELAGAPRPGLEAHRGAGGDVEAKAARRRAVEFERGVGLGEVVVRADLDRAVAGVAHHQRARGAADGEFDVAVGDEEFSGDHRPAPHTIGLCTVTSLVPSGNVASTWMSGTSSGTPSITSARVSRVAPKLISSATGRPSRAPSRIAQLISATASG